MTKIMFYVFLFMTAGGAAVAATSRGAIGLIAVGVMLLGMCMLLLLFTYEIEKEEKATKKSRGCVEI